jgi:hypothetical protein
MPYDNGIFPVFPQYWAIFINFYSKNKTLTFQKIQAGNVN